MTISRQLLQQLQQLDGKSYKAYKALRGGYDFPTFKLWIDHVQGDPFAAPSRLRVVLSQQQAGFPADCWETPVRATATADYLHRRFALAARQQSERRGSGKSGQITMASPSQAILQRSAVTVTAEAVEVRFQVGLPAFGRRIAGAQAAALLCEDLPAVVQHSLDYARLPAAEVTHHGNVAEDAVHLRQQMQAQGLIAFIANGAILPRRSGVDERPLAAGVPFISPPSLQVELSRPHGQPVSGMGIPAGITLIVGGGYHGKSTLLRAIATGIYNHVPGDGREQVVSHPQALKVRSEDGRSVASVDISPFIDHLPQGQPTQAFSTANASGSTSQAASIVEAVEAGVQVLLVDEDTSATNFMIRDRRMQALVAKDREPITPFIDKVRQLYEQHGISTVLVMGGSGDYFDVADRVIALDSFCAQDVTAAAQTIAHTYVTHRQVEGGSQFPPPPPRCIPPEAIDPSRGRRSISIKVRGVDELSFGAEIIDLSAVEQLVEPGQLRAIGAAMAYARRHWLDGQRDLATVLAAVLADVERAGLDCLEDWPTGDLVSFRQLELAAAINRLRPLTVKPLQSLDEAVQ